MLFDGIVDEDEHLNRVYSLPRVSGNAEGLKEDDFLDLVDEGDYLASDTSEDEHYNVGGRQGF